MVGTPVGRLLIGAWVPLRLALDCQTQQRVDICTYIRGSLDAQEVVAVVPLSEAQVVLHLNATSEGTTDFVQLRAVNDLNAGVVGAPASFEQDVELDYRRPVDEHRSGLEPVLFRVLAPYLSLAVPGAVSVSITKPNGVETTETKRSPWGFSAWGGGYGNWSDNYRSLNVWTGLSLSRKTNDNAQYVWVNFDRSIELQPSLVINSTEVELTSDSSSVVGALNAGWNLNDHWTVGGSIRGGADDPEGQYLGTGRAHVGVEYNLFPSNDPRGNRLAAAWLVGAQGDAYNQTNTLGEDTAFFPTQMLLGSGSVRVDTVSLTLDLSVKSQIAPFFERYVLGGSVETDLTLGDHVDLQLEFRATQQAIPGPSSIDTSDYEEVTRASYAEPLEMNGWINVRFHWDNTNSARNNRFETVGDVEATGGL